MDGRNDPTKRRGENRLKTKSLNQQGAMSNNKFFTKNKPDCFKKGHNTDFYASIIEDQRRHFFIHSCSEHLRIKKSLSI